MANIALAGCLVFTLWWRLAAQRAGEPFLAPFRRPSPLSLPLGVFVALSALACFLSTSPARSIPQLKGLVAFALVPLTLALVRGARDADLLLDLWRLGALAMIADGLAQYVSGADNVLARVSGWQSIYMTYAGLLMALSLALLGRGFSRGRTRLSRTLDLSVCALGVTAVTLTLTRGAVLGLLAGVLALLLVARPKLLPLVPVAAAAFAFALPRDIRERALSAFDARDETARDRVLMWRAGARMIADHPLAGVGPKQINALYPAYALPGAHNMRPGHLHDNAVMIAAETGVPSALAYLWLMGAFAWGAVRLARSREPASAAARAALAALAGLFVAGLFEYNFGDVEILRATLVLMALPFAVRTEAAS